MSNVSLIVASLDLQLVRLLRGAMRAADCAGPHNCDRISCDPTHRTDLARPVLRSDQRFEPRPVVEPTPRFEPRKTIHPQPRIEQQPPICPDPGQPHSCHPPFLPPWRQHGCPAPAPVVIKVIHRTTDVIHKGSLLDLFI